jgi:hypothetical protein
MSAAWTIDEALNLIREIEPEVKRSSFCFLALCGGVLRNGKSEKDLDIFIIPMNSDSAADVVGAIALIGSRLGVEFRQMNAAKYNGQKFIPIQFYGAEWNEKRIELITQ